MHAVAHAFLPLLGSHAFVPDQRSFFSALVLSFQQVWQCLLVDKSAAKPSKHEDKEERERRKQEEKQKKREAKQQQELQEQQEKQKRKEEKQQQELQEQLEKQKRKEAKQLKEQQEVEEKQRKKQLKKQVGLLSGLLDDCTVDHTTT